MPNPVRTKVEVQEDRLAREHNALARPHPETAAPRDKLGRSVETEQIDDVEPTEVDERRSPESQDAVSDPTAEATTPKKGNERRA